MSFQDRLAAKMEEEAWRCKEAHNYLTGEQQAVQQESIVVRGSDDLARAVQALVKATEGGRAVEMSLRGVM